ncbi:zinc ribbon domain-containing protein [Ruminococcaceae bacterium OttesenSCG-928-N02]|nr:zinc ribbon domain-containing protein [Ruminococcaceae bacterium OttesenSCG-928-N02]
MTCPSCGHEVGTSARFCGLCGTLISRQRTPSPDTNAPSLPVTYTKPAPQKNTPTEHAAGTHIIYNPTQPLPPQSETPISTMEYAALCALGCVPLVGLIVMVILASGAFGRRFTAFARGFLLAGAVLLVGLVGYVFFFLAALL